MPKAIIIFLIGLLVVSSIIFHSQEIRIIIAIGVLGLIFAGIIFSGKRLFRGFEDISPSMFKEVRGKVERREIDPHTYLKLLQRRIAIYEKEIEELERKNLPIPSDIEEQLFLSKEEIKWLKSRFKLNK